MRAKNAIRIIGFVALGVIFVATAGDGYAARGGFHLWFDDLTNTVNGSYDVLPPCESRDQNGDGNGNNGQSDISHDTNGDGNGNGGPGGRCR